MSLGSESSSSQTYDKQIYYKIYYKRGYTIYNLEDCGVVLSKQDCSAVICQCQGRTSTPWWWIEISVVPRVGVEISVVPRVGEVIGDATPCCHPVLFWDTGREYAQNDCFSRILVLPPYTHIVVL